MPFQLPTTPAEWAALDELVHNRHDASVSRGAHIIIWLVTITGPIPGILYLISAVKRCRTNGWWMVRIDEGGYLYPHNRVMLTFWVVAFTIVNLALSISVLFDCRSFLHPRTLILQTISFYTLSCLGSLVPILRYAAFQIPLGTSEAEEQLRSPTIYQTPYSSLPVQPVNHHRPPCLMEFIAVASRHFQGSVRGVVIVGSISILLREHGRSQFYPTREVSKSASGSPFFGADASFSGNHPRAFEEDIHMRTSDNYRAADRYDLVLVPYPGGSLLPSKGFAASGIQGNKFGDQTGAR
ncbi:hypothetical protein H4Q26_002694 [Puccinia striiformis f. sp. tritici PST-130]|nr:hypothetical protein H4Q26_002694 [Puccinia striiformis f. sp. tritici PST-130]